jgi:hypothetical protein
MKRFILIIAVVCVLAAKLLIFSGTAHAQEQTKQQVSTSRSAKIADGGGYNYFFNAGWWGWGLCISHDTLQGLERGGTGTGIVYALIHLKWGGINPTVAIAASITFGAIFWTLDSLDRGNGVCVGWPYYLPAIPIPWAQ